MSRDPRSVVPVGESPDALHKPRRQPYIGTRGLVHLIRCGALTAREFIAFARSDADHVMRARRR